MTLKTLAGDDGNNQLFGLDDAEFLDGRAGDDLLVGMRGDDVLDGGAGNDVLDGGEGNNVYLFGRGSGHDIIQSFSRSATQVEVIQLGADLTPQDVQVHRMADDLLIHVVGSGDELVVRNYFVKQYGVPDSATSWQASPQVLAPSLVEQIRFADGTRWDELAVQKHLHDARPPAMPNDFDDYITSSWVAEGGAGNDELVGYGDSVALEGGTGNDLLRVAQGSAVMLGGAGDDILRGGAGNDLLDGGAGDDQLDTGSGFDNVLFGRGAGHDTLVRGSEGYWGETHTTINLAAGILPGAVAVELVPGGPQPDLVLRLLGSGDTLRFTLDGLERTVKFADGTLWNMAELMNQAQRIHHTQVGTDMPEGLDGSWDNDELIGLGGDDFLMGGDGDNVLVGGDGNDVLVGFRGSDTFDGGAGDDTIDLVAGNDVLLFGRASGNDQVRHLERDTVLTVVLGDDIAASDLVLLAGPTPGELRVSVRNAPASLTFHDYGVAYDPTFKPAVVQFQFANGLVWGSDEIGRQLYMGTDGPDQLIGGAGNDVLTGKDGDDLLDGREGDDVLNGGRGNDFLYVHSGADVLKFSAGDGNDTVDLSWYQSAPATPGSAPGVTLAFDATVKPAGVSAAFSGDSQHADLTLRYDGGVITVRGYLEAGQSRVAGIAFADGTVWNSEAIARLRFTGTDAPDHIEGGAGDDLLDGKGGADDLLGNGGNDTLLGGDGGDRLEGGSGNDTVVGGRGDDTLFVKDADLLRFTAGDGHDVVDTRGFDPASSAARIVFDASVNSAGVSGTLIGDWQRADLSLRYDGGIIDVIGFIDQGKQHVGTIEFADGKVFNAEDLARRPLYGGANRDQLIGGSANDLLSGKGGDDLLRGGLGSDKLLGGDGNDSLDGEGGNDILEGGRGNDTLVVRSGADLLRFASGDGRDTVDLRYYDSAATGVTISLGAGITPASVKLAFTGTQSHGNLSLRYDGGVSSIDVIDYALAGQHHVQAIVFADGTVWNDAAIAKLVGIPPALA
ncbi:MAG: calcium-binding protein [Gammaproteobacteria bacterium]